MKLPSTKLNMGTSKALKPTNMGMPPVAEPFSAKKLSLPGAKNMSTPIKPPKLKTAAYAVGVQAAINEFTKSAGVLGRMMTGAKNVGRKMTGKPLSPKNIRGTPSGELKNTLKSTSGIRGTPAGEIKKPLSLERPVWGTPPEKLGTLSSTTKQANALMRMVGNARNAGRKMVGKAPSPSNVRGTPASKLKGPMGGDASQIRGTTKDNMRKPIPDADLTEPKMPNRNGRSAAANGGSPEAQMSQPMQQQGRSAEMVRGTPSGDMRNPMQFEDTVASMRNLASNPNARMGATAVGGLGLGAGLHSAFGPQEPKFQMGPLAWMG